MNGLIRCLRAQAPVRFLLGAALHALWLTGMAAFPALAADDCAPTRARVVSLQGGVDYRRADATAWLPARLNLGLCPGDGLRVRENSRAALRMNNETTVRLDQATAVTFPREDAPKQDLMDLARGVVHFITRTPRPFRVNTPFLNAGVEGTEFLVAATAEEARVVVLEGKVAVANAAGALRLLPGESASATGGNAPAWTRLLHPENAVHWALYYPDVSDAEPVVDEADAELTAALRRSAALQTEGRAAEALQALESAPGAAASAQAQVRRAALLLAAGRDEEASAILERTPERAAALALRAVIALTRNDRDAALALAQQARAAQADGYAALMALSYVEQAHFRLDAALAALQRLTAAHPAAARAWARLAEIQLALGEREAAATSARRAAELGPRIARARVVRGFVALARTELAAARAAFEEAVELDSGDPMPRLGLGLTRIRGGDLAGGREQIEIAVSLDPNNALLRAYLGKAYLDEGRAELAAAQLALAQGLDPRDPTPPYYDALRLNSEGRALSALEALRLSLALNDNRAVQRSRRDLQGDAAARGAALARAYSDAGFHQLAYLEAAKAMEQDPDSHAAHRFLADAYAALPGHEIARASELLQAQLRQPLASAPTPVDLGDDRNNPGGLKLGVLKGMGPDALTASEFNRAFDSNGLAAYVDALAGSRDTLSAQAVAVGVHDNWSYSVGSYHFESDGYGPDASARKDVHSAFVQNAVNERLSWQAEYRRLASVRDQVSYAFDPAAAGVERAYERVDNLRLGGRYRVDPDSDVLLSLIRRDYELDMSAPGVDRFRLWDSDGLTAEVQYNHQSGPLSLSLGGGRNRDRSDFFGVTHAHYDNVYVYSSYRLASGLPTLHLGLSHDRFEVEGWGRSHSNPKFGLTWQPTPATTIRAAAALTMKRQLLANQSLEPTQVAGFNQFFDDQNGSRVRYAGLALDQRLADNLDVGVKAYERDISSPVLFSADNIVWEEKTARAHVYWHSPSNFLSLSGEAEFQRVNRPLWTGESGVDHMDTRILPLRAALFLGNGVSARFTLTQVHQEGMLLSWLGNAFPTDNDFVTADLGLIWRLPGRRGNLEAGVRNLSGRDIRFVELDPVNPRFAPDRFTYLRLNLAF